MNCPKCGAGLYVVHSLSDENGVYRRRKCKECGEAVFTTELSTDASKTMYLDVYSEIRDYYDTLHKKEIENGRK